MNKVCAEGIYLIGKDEYTFKGGIPTRYKCIFKQ